MATFITLSLIYPTSINPRSIHIHCHRLSRSLADVVLVNISNLTIVLNLNPVAFLTNYHYILFTISEFAKNIRFCRSTLANICVAIVCN